MSFGMCPNCFNKLTEDSSIVTEPSSIFKGDNIYIMCKNCQQVLLYNKARDIIFDLDEYKEDKGVVEEINKLLSKIDNHYEVPSSCAGNCDSCSGCAVEPDHSYQRKTSRTKPVPHEEPIIDTPAEPSVTETKEMITSTLAKGLLAVNAKDPTVKLILVNTSDLDDLDLEEWVFFEMNPVEVKVKKVYDIVRQ